MRHPKEVLPIEQEIVGEKAATLGRAGERFAQALAALALLDERIARGDEEARARRPDARAHAAERLWVLMVQREAVGLRHHEGIFQHYQVPRDVRALAGPRRR